MPQLLQSLLAQMHGQLNIVTNCLDPNQQMSTVYSGIALHCATAGHTTPSSARHSLGRDPGLRDPRPQLRPRLLILALGSIIAANWIPDTGSFDTVWMWFGFNDLLFIILRIVLINIKLKVNG